MRNQLLFAFSFMIALIFSSCSKDLTALDPSLFKCNPNPLEVKGGKVNATITGTFPVKYFNKNAVCTVTPVLKYAGKETKGTPSVFQGEKVKGNNQTITYKAGGTYTMNVSFNYVPEMETSELFLEFSVVSGKKTYQIPSVKVADGVIATSQLASSNASEINAVIIPDKFQRVIQEKQEADILFAIQKSDLNSKETKASDVVELTKKIKEAKETQNKQVSNFEVSGYASPDGSVDMNNGLAEKRSKATVDYMNKEIKKIKANVTLSSKFTAEDWDGFQKLMETSDIQDKQVILRVLSMYQDPEQREREIKNLSVAYKSIAEDVLPKLRRSRLQLTIDVTGKSDEQISAAAKSDTAKLSVEELLYAATLTQNMDEKAAIYQKVTTQYPNDVRGFNNLGVVKYNQGNTAEAAKLFAKALEIDSKNADVNFNAGIDALAQGNTSKAEEYFGKAAGTSGNLNQALGTVYTVRGDYSKAKSHYGSTATNNAALNQIMNADYAAARQTLAAIAQPNATTYYLGAIVGARTNDRDAVYTNLRKSVSADKAMATKAAKDIEFSKFRTDASFMEIVK